MKTILSTIIFCLVSIVLMSQIDSLKTISFDGTIIVNDLNESKNELENMFDEFGLVPDLFFETKHGFKAKFYLAKDGFIDLNSKMEKWGIISSKRMESINYLNLINPINGEIERLKKEISKYDSLLNLIEVKSGFHIQYWEKLESRKEELKAKESKRKEYLNNHKKFLVEIEVREENFYTYEPDFSFVNMPGIQYSFFKISNNQEAIFPNKMNGFSLKYLLNRQKTYLELGLFKSTEKQELEVFDELYKFGIGQDFYSAHLGRGNRKLFNLYSGLNTGIFILTGNEKNVISWYATPSIGLELFKTKNILIDSKIGYFLPFKENRNMRGWLSEVSFNIVF